MRVCAIGDSFVNGTGDPECLGWIGRLVAAEKRWNPEVTLYNLGVRGDTSADIRARWRREAEARFAAQVDGRIIFSFGVNDCCLDPKTGRPRVDPASATDNTSAILAAAGRFAPTLMVGPPPIADDGVNARVSALDGALAEAARWAQVPYLGVFEVLSGLDAWMRGVESWDGAHPGAEAYAALALEVSEWAPWTEWFATG